MTGQAEQQGVEVGILTDDEKADINMRLDQIAAHMDSETHIATALGAIVEEFGEPRGLTVSVDGRKTGHSNFDLRATGAGKENR